MKRIDLIKAGGFVAGEHLAVSEVSVPELSAENKNDKDEQVVIIQVKASAINPVDWKMAQYNFYLPETLPAALGCDVSGVITHGPAEDKIGKRVVAYLGANKTTAPTTRGAYVEQVAMESKFVMEIPDSMSFAQAASLPVGALTAELLLDALPSPPAEGETWILVWGASSSVGFNCIQLAVKRGWKPIAVASEKHKDRLVNLGAAAFVDYRTETNVPNKVKEILAGTALHGAADCIGDSSSFGTCAQILFELGQAGDNSKVVSTVGGSPVEPPTGVTKTSVNLGMGRDDPAIGKLIQSWMSEIVQLQPMPIRLIKGPFQAETLQEAFQVSKDGVSGEKVVIEWE